MAKALWLGEPFRGGETLGEKLVERRVLESGERLLQRCPVSPPFLSSLPFPSLPFPSLPFPCLPLFSLPFPCFSLTFNLSGYAFNPRHAPGHEKLRFSHKYYNKIVIIQKKSVQKNGRFGKVAEAGQYEHIEPVLTFLELSKAVSDLILNCFSPVKVSKNIYF